MFLRWIGLVIALGLLFTWMGPAHAQKIALVIGNGKYKGQPLTNPRNDARDMERALKSLGFKVTRVEDATQREFTRAITKFGESIVSSESIVLFYYAGHGIQVGGRNYLIPVDAEIGSEASVLSESVDLDRILSQIGTRNPKTSVVILDACRNNPFERRFRGSSGGLAQVTAPGNMLISYATGPGDVAADGDGRNGIFTAALLQHLSTPGLRVEDVFKRVRASVTKATKGAQIPWESSSLLDDLYFVPVVAATPPKEDLEAELWSQIKESQHAADFEYFLSRYPQGKLSGLAQNRLASMRLTPTPTHSVPDPANTQVAAAAVRRFTPAALPNRESTNIDAAVAFTNAPKPKAMAISRDGNVSFVDRGDSIAEVKRRALERCIFVHQTDCALYAVDEVFVGEGQSWVGRQTLPRAGDAFDADAVPFVRDAARSGVSSYSNAPGFKALAIAPDGAWRWLAGRGSSAEAISDALEGCQKNTRLKCALYAVGDQVVFGSPAH